MEDFFLNWGAEISKSKNLNHPAAPVQSDLLQSVKVPSIQKNPQKTPQSFCQFLQVVVLPHGCFCISDL